MVARYLHAMTPEQIALVQASFARVVPITAEAAAVFYGNLFDLAPDTRGLFRRDMAEQGRKLFLTLATVVDALDQIEQVLPVARALAVRHVGYGAREDHYGAVGSALLATLRSVLGDRFDRDTEAAWTDAWSVVATCMIEAARDAAPAAVTPVDTLQVGDVDAAARGACPFPSYGHGAA